MTRTDVYFAKRSEEACFIAGIIGDLLIEPAAYAFATIKLSGDFLNQLRRNMGIHPYKIVKSIKVCHCSLKFSGV